MGWFPSESICGRPLRAGCIFIGSRELIFNCKKTFRESEQYAKAVIVAQPCFLYPC